MEAERNQSHWSLKDTKDFQTRQKEDIRVFHLKSRQSKRIDWKTKKCYVTSCLSSKSCHSICQIDKSSEWANYEEIQRECMTREGKNNKGWHAQLFAHEMGSQKEDELVMSGFTILLLLNKSMSEWKIPVSRTRTLSRITVLYSLLLSSWRLCSLKSFRGNFQAQYTVIMRHLSGNGFKIFSLSILSHSTGRQTWKQAIFGG